MRGDSSGMVKETHGINGAKSAADKRTNPPRDVDKSKDFLKDWENLAKSGKHDLNVLKEVMLLLIANDAPLSAEWKDHKLKGKYKNFRECHVKGDLLLVYKIYENSHNDLIMFSRAGTHAEIFS